MKLYFNPASPFVRKVLVVAKECGVADQLEIEEIALTPVNPHIPVSYTHLTLPTILLV